jgi:hypothetical protein
MAVAAVASTAAVVAAPTVVEAADTGKIADSTAFPRSAGVLMQSPFAPASGLCFYAGPFLV